MDALIGILTKIYNIIVSYIEDRTKISDGSTKIAYQEFTYTLAAGERREVFQVFNYFRVLSMTTSAALSVRFGQNGLETPFSGQGVGLQCEDIFSRCTLINTSGVSMAITIALAYGRVNDDRLNVSSTLTIGEVIPGILPNDLGKAAYTQTVVSGDVGVSALRRVNSGLGGSSAADGKYFPASVDPKGVQYVRQAALNVYSLQSTVSTTAVNISPANAPTGEVLVKAGTLDMYIGPAGVTTSSGFLVEAGTSVGFNGLIGDLWAIRASGSATAYMISTQG